MINEKKVLLQNWIKNFNTNAYVQYNKNEYRIIIKELESIYSSCNFWHSKTDPSSWLSQALVSMAKRKFYNKLPRKKVIQLCAELLNITVDKLENNLDWNANYMAWHDGRTPKEHHAWEDDEE